MKYAQAKTLAPLLILRILEERSDEKHPLTREEIQRILDEEHSISLERKTFARHIKDLNRLPDVDICSVTVKTKTPDKRPCNGYYLKERLFNEMELRVIIDALSGSHYLSQWETEDLVTRLSQLSSRHFQKKLKSYQFVSRGAKTTNETLMFNLEIIDEAITEQKQISFDFLCTNSHGQREISSRPREVCTPIRYFVKDHNYYLVAVKAVDEELRKLGAPLQEGGLQLEAYTLSDIDNVEKLDIPAQNYHTLPEFRQGMDWQKFLQSHPTMKWLWWKPDLCTFLCSRSKIEEIKLHFGNDVRIRTLNNAEFQKARSIFPGDIARDGLVEVSVFTDRYIAAEFARSYHTGIWVVYPKPARALVRTTSLAQLEVYDKLEQQYVTGEKFSPMNLSYNPLFTD